MKKLIKTDDGELTLTINNKTNLCKLTLKNNNNKSSLTIDKSEVIELIVNLMSLDKENEPENFYAYSMISHIWNNNNIYEQKYQSTDNEEANVYIALPQKTLDIFTIESIQNACGEFMESLGFEFKTQNEPVYGSFFQKIIFKLKSEKTKKEVNTLYKKGKEALEANYLNLPTAEATGKLAEAAASLINAISNTDEAAIRLGAIVIVKTKINNKTVIITETVSPTLATMLDNAPNILANPRAIYELLNVEKMKTNVFDENEDVVDNPQIGRNI